MDELKFRRQYLFSARQCKELSHWQQETFGDYIIYAHRDCPLAISNKPSRSAALLGHVVDPDSPDDTSADILNRVALLPDSEAIPGLLYGLTGRFVLIIREGLRYYFYHDACGLKTVFYTHSDGQFYAASQPLLLDYVIPLERSGNYEQYYSSRYVRSQKEHYIPAGATLYKGIRQLVPNHYLDVMRDHQIRYFPTRRLKKRDRIQAVKDYSEWMRKTMHAFGRHHKLALSMSSGLDSRVILSACRDFPGDIVLYSLIYHDLDENSKDILIPASLSEKLGFEHILIDCNRESDDEFDRIYAGNTDTPHSVHWGRAAHGMLAGYPQDRISVKGNCAEISRCPFYKYSRPPRRPSPGFFLKTQKGWDDIPFIKNHIIGWLENARMIKDDFGYELPDFFYWELGMGGWMARNQLEWDIVKEVHFPYNSRALHDISLGVSHRYRRLPDTTFFRDVIRNLWPDVLEEPIYPRKTRSRMVKKTIKQFLRDSGLLKSKKSRNDFDQTAQS